MTSDTNEFEMDEDDDIFGHGNFCEDVVKNNEEILQSNSHQPPVDEDDDDAEHNSQLEESAYFVSQSQSGSRPGTRGSNASAGSFDLFPSQKLNSPSPSVESSPKTPTSNLNPGDCVDFEEDDHDEFLSQVMIEITNLTPEETNEVDFTENNDANDNGAVVDVEMEMIHVRNHIHVVPDNPMTPATGVKNQNRISQYPTHVNESADLTKKVPLRRWNSPPIVKKRVHRRFPGPAGLLPNLKPSEISRLDSPSPSKLNPVSQQVERILSKESFNYSQNSSQSGGSQSDLSIFERRPWCELRDQLGLGSPDNDYSSCLEIMNIDWILTKAKRFPSGLRIPFLVVALQEAPELMNAQAGKFKPPCVKLVDPSGSILAAMDSNFASTYAGHLNLGTTLALQNVGLLHFKRQLVLTITKRNLILMTSCPDNTDTPMRNEPPGTTETSDGVKVINFCDFLPDKIMDNFYQLDSLRSIALIEGGNTEQIRKEQRPASALFTTVQYSSRDHIPPVSRAITVDETEEEFGDEDEFFKALGDLEFLNNSEEF